MPPATSMTRQAGQRFTIDALGYVTELRYDAMGQVSSTLQYERSFKLSAAPTEAEMMVATQVVTTSFASSLEGFNGGAGVWRPGRTSCPAGRRRAGEAGPPQAAHAA